MRRLLLSAAVGAFALASTVGHAQTLSNGGGGGTVLSVACANVTITATGSCKTTPTAGTTGDVIISDGANGATDSGSLLSSLAPLASPALSGNPTAPTQTGSDNSTRLATTAFVQGAVAGGGATIHGTPTAGNCTSWFSASAIQDSGSPCGGAAGANPTASLGLSAVNGSAATFMRSDAAPALDQTIAPTMSGNWAFSANGALSDAGPAIVESGTPITGGSGTTTTPMHYLDCSGSTDPTTYSTSGTFLGINSCSGWAGSFLDFHLNGAASVFLVGSNGALTITGGFTTAGGVQLGASDAVTFNGRGTLSSPAAYQVEFGTDAAAGAAQTVRFSNATTATLSGGNDTIKFSTGATSGIGGDGIFQVAPTGTLGYRTAFTINHLGVPVKPAFTVATLPASPPTGSFAYVSDQLTACAASGAALTGGGSVACPAFYNGSAWVGD